MTDQNQDKKWVVYAIGHQIDRLYVRSREFTTERRWASQMPYDNAIDFIKSQGKDSRFKAWGMTPALD